MVTLFAVMVVGAIVAVVVVVFAVSVCTFDAAVAVSGAELWVYIYRYI